MAYCEDYPCCGHTPGDPCDGSFVMEPWYCDECGFHHVTLTCPAEDWWDEDDDPDWDEW